jgi:hypothetical protein
MMAIMAGSLNDPGWYRPAMDFYTASAQPWVFMNPALPKFPKSIFLKFIHQKND